MAVQTHDVVAGGRETRISDQPICHSTESDSAASFHDTCRRRQLDAGQPLSVSQQ